MTIDHKTDREQAKQWASDLLTDGNWAILDTETTGLNPTAQICQVAVLTPITSWQILVKPTIPIAPEATAVHGITDDLVSHAPQFIDVFLDLLKEVGKRDVVIYDAQFDLRLIKQSLRPYGVQLAFPTSDRRQCRIFTNGGSIHCAMHWYSQWIGDWSDYHHSYRWQQLPGGDHSALGDCRATLRIIEQMARAKAF
jgi:DNA polymerase-3 subunit epsilon